VAFLFQRGWAEWNVATTSFIAFVGRWNPIFFFFIPRAPPSFDFQLSRLFRFDRTAVCTLRSTSSKRKRERRLWSKKRGEKPKPLSSLHVHPVELEKQPKRRRQKRRRRERKVTIESTWKSCYLFFLVAQSSSYTPVGLLFGSLLFVHFLLYCIFRRGF
jgi:hypothetical protein